MAATVTWEGLRDLATFRAENGCAISFYLDLDPGVSPTAGAIDSRINALLDEIVRSEMANRAQLTHEQKQGLRDDVARLREFFDSDFSRERSHGYAVYCAGLDNVWQPLPLSERVPDLVKVGRTFYLAPLVPLIGRGDGVLVAFVGRERGDLYRLRGGRLEPLANEFDEQPGRHDQGGWSQARYQRSVDKEAVDHLKRAADVLFRHFRRLPFEHLLVGGPQETITDFESRVHPYLAERLAGRVDVDVENTNAEQVLESARPCFEEVEERREREALARLDEGSRAGAGLDNVLRPLNERRVEALLLDDAFSAPGSECPECGWLGPEGTDRCPADGTPTLRLDDLTEPVVELALRQSAALMPIRRNYEELRRRGGIAVLCRF